MTDKREGLDAVIAVGSQWMERAIAAEQAREADQQTIADLRGQLRQAEQKLEWTHKEIDDIRQLLEVPVGVTTLEAVDVTKFMADRVKEQDMTIAELRKALAEARLYVGRLAGGQHVGKVLSQGEAVKLLGRIDALAAIAAAEESHDHVGGLMSIPAYKATQQEGMARTNAVLLGNVRDLLNQLQAERERAEKAEASQSAIAWAEQLHRAQIAETDLQAEREKSAGLERQLERHAGLLHMAVHNWALYSVADCPEVECEEYRALERIKQ